MSAPKWLRPSALPKLALCGQFRGDPVSSDAAARGTKLDEVFRQLIAKQNVDVSELDQEERIAVKWAENTALILADGKPLESREENLRVEVLGMTGTADLLCIEGRWSADLKTGIQRNYLEQQAAYALGFMDQYFCEEWTVHLLYCDEASLETFRFTREEADAIVRHVLTNAKDNAPARPNDYCGWCARRFDCSARKEQLGLVLKDATVFDLKAAKSEALRSFILAAKTIEDYVDQARAELLERILTGGEKVAGVSKVNGKTTRTMEAIELEPVLTAIGAARFLNALGTLSEGEAKKLWDFTEMPWPSDRLQEKHGAAYVRVSHPKEAK